MRNPNHALDLLKRPAPPLLLLLGLASAQATELVYVPVNPNFGGSPLNGATLLNQAQAQNRHKDPDMDDGKKSPIEELNDAVQRVVIGRVAAAISSNIVGDNGGLKEGTVDIQGLRITVTKNPDGTYRLYAVGKGGTGILDANL